MIEVQGLTKSFRALRAVSDLSLVARDGEITGLIGPNGAGKTTTFRVIYGLLRPDAGAVRVDGYDVVADRIAAQRRLGALPDVRGLYPRLTAREHIRYFGRLQGLDGPDLDHRIDSLCTRLDMTDIADRRARGFSRGQELKVALARALVHQPHNIILDEPTNGLDVVSSRAVRALIREMRDAGRCVLISSHIMSEVSALCDRLAIITHGRLVAEGTLAELRARAGTDDLEEVFIGTLQAAPGEPPAEDAA